MTDAPPDRPESPPIVRTALIFYGILGAGTLAWAAWGDFSLLYLDAAARVRGVDPLRDAGAGLLAGAIVILVSNEITRRTAWGEQLARVLAALLGPLTTRQCVVLALASGVVEEAFFRGALQPRIGLVAASLLFGLAHFAPRRELLPWTLFSVAAGFLLGGLFAATGNLVAPVVAHASINAVNLRLLSTRYAEPSSPQAS